MHHLVGWRRRSDVRGQKLLVGLGAAHQHGADEGDAEAASDIARERGDKVVPLCGFVRAFIARNPAYADLLK